MDSPPLENGNGADQATVLVFMEYGRFPKRTFEQDRTPQTRKERRGAGEAFPRPEKSGTGRRNTRQGR